MLGTATKRERANPPLRADVFAAITLSDHEARPVCLAELWQDGPAVLVWLRHYG